LVAKLSKNVSVEEVNDAFKKYENGELKGILGTDPEPSVSVDFRGDSRSSIIDLLSTKVLDGGYVKVVSWYDNEWGYVSRVVDLIKWFCK
jgi:glyceraldehyde 3-phosphate dehydrogenase